MKESQVDIEISEREGEKEEKWRRKEKKGRVEDVDKRAKERASRYITGLNQTSE